MSGIAGIIRFDGENVDAGLISVMTSAMRHRGPDGISHWSGRGVALGHCLLKATPESVGEIQPFRCDEPPLALVFDGRLDNREELRRALAGHEQLSQHAPDPEFVLAAYRRWGEACAERLDGDFAFAIWNASTRRLFCARDRVGLRPLHYCRVGDVFAFASEVKPLIDLPWIDPRPNEGMIAEYLASEFHTLDETLWEGIHRLKARHCMHVDAGGMSHREYWAPDPDAVLHYSGENEYVEHYLSMLERSVRCVSRSATPVAFEVSGGLDSSALFAVACRQLEAGFLPAPAVHGFSLAFDDEPDAEEREYSRSLAAHLGREVMEVPASLPSLEWYMDLARRHADFPGYPNSGMALGLRQRATDLGCRVIVSGTGGDEWLNGRGTHYSAEIRARRWGNVRSDWRADVGERGWPIATSTLIRGCLGPYLPEGLKRSLRKHGPLPEPERSTSWLDRRLARHLDERRARTNSLQHRDQRHRGLASMLADPFHALAFGIEDRWTADLGLELRMPFHSAELVQFSCSLPDRYKFRAGLHKYLHRQAMVGLLPELVRRRPTKASFDCVFRDAFTMIPALEIESLIEQASSWLSPSASLALWRTATNDPTGGAWAKWQVWALLVLAPGRQ